MLYLDIGINSFSNFINAVRSSKDKNNTKIRHQSSSQDMFPLARFSKHEIPADQLSDSRYPESANSFEAYRVEKPSQLKLSKNVTSFLFTKPNPTLT